MSPFIPHLILRDIFIYLSTEDSNISLHTLHACMLVNRHWCSNAVPIYWSKPFRHTSPSLINTFLRSLSSSERNAITRVQDNSLPSTTDKLHYNYPLYLRDLDYWAFMKSVKAYIARATMTTTKNNESKPLIGVRDGVRETNNENLRHVMSSEIIKMFIRLGVNLYHLRVLTWEDQLDSNEYLLLLKPELHSFLTPVRELEIAACYQKSVFLSSLAKICRNIHSMHLTLANWGSPEDNGKEEMLGLSELIRAQKSLIRIRFWTFRHYGSNIEYVLDAMQKQAEFLKEIDLHDVNFTAAKPLTNIAACYNLERLALKGCDINGRVISPLMCAKFPRLGKVEVCSCHNNELKEWAAWMNSPLKYWNREKSFIGHTSGRLQMCTT